MEGHPRDQLRPSCGRQMRRRVTVGFFEGAPSKVRLGGVFVLGIEGQNPHPLSRRTRKKDGAPSREIFGAGFLHFGHRSVADKAPWRML